jgi:hypothetical protein
MTFDYDAIINSLPNKGTSLNLGGLYIVKRILECFKICPYVDVVASFLHIGEKNAYAKLRYYLDKGTLMALYDDLEKRKIQIMNDIKNEFYSKLH